MPCLPHRGAASCSKCRLDGHPTAPERGVRLQKGHLELLNHCSAAFSIFGIGLCISDLMKTREIHPRFRAWCFWRLSARTFGPAHGQGQVSLAASQPWGRKGGASYTVVRVVERRQG